MNPLTPIHVVKTSLNTKQSEHFFSSTLHIYILRIISYAVIYKFYHTQLHYIYNITCFIIIIFSKAIYILQKEHYLVQPTIQPSPEN